MKTRIILLAALVACTVMSGMSQSINLPAPALSDTATLKYALEHRCSTRNYEATQKIGRQELANLLWAGWGYNRTDKRTAPSALDKQEITLYVCTHDGAYMYDALNNSLELISKNDIMEITGKQAFVVDAGINIVYVCNTDDYASVEMSAICCGSISQNIALYCASVGLGNVVRGSFEADKLLRALHLSHTDKIIMVQSVGYPAL